MALASLGLVACAGVGQDLDNTGSTTTGAAPDVTGVYDATFDGDGTCADPTFPEQVVAGEVEVRGPDGASPTRALTFDFAAAAGGESSVVGSVDEAFTLVFGGAVAVDGWSLTLDAVGLAYIDADADRWVLDGDLVVVGQAGESASTSDPCTSSGTWTAIARGGR